MSKGFALLLSIAVGVAVYFFLPMPQSMEASVWRLFAIFIATISALITRPAPVGAVVLLSSCVLLATQTLTLDELFQAYESESIWLIFFAFFLARGLINSGLATRGAFLFVKTLGSSPLGMAYGLILSECCISPFIPSLVARSGGIVFPITLALVKNQYGEEKSESKGGFLLLSAIHGSAVCSGMFLTAMAANPLAVGIAKDFGLEITWLLWAKAAFLPSVVSLALVPLCVYWLLPPSQSEGDMRALATKKLIDIGPVSLREWTTLATFACILFLWVCGTNFGISSALAAMIGVTVLLFVNVFDWEDCLKEKSAWDTLFWLGVLIGMSSSLKTKGFFDGYSDDLIAMTAHLDWQVALCIIAVIYYYCHYFFASNTTHIMAMFSAFLYASLQTGAPPLIAFFTLALASNLYGCLTHYSSGPAPVYFGASYVSLRTWWKVGFILSTIHLIVLLTVGLAWWKYLGI